jgi:hypothetical protein
MSKKPFIFMLMMIVAAGLALAQTGRTAKPDNLGEKTAWVARSLAEMKTVKAGMTRGELLRVFREEGGLSTATRRTYAYRDCVYIKTDVEFSPATPRRDPDGADRPVEADADVIASISKPYLDWPIAD